MFVCVVCVVFGGGCTDRIRDLPFLVCESGIESVLQSRTADSCSELVLCVVQVCYSLAFCHTMVVVDREATAVTTAVAVSVRVRRCVTGDGMRQFKLNEAAISAVK